MSDVLGADPAGLRSAGPAFDSLAGAVGLVAARLRVALDREGACWGSDEAGSQFAATYLEAATAARAALPALSDAVTAVGAAVLEVADAVEAADGRARSRLGG